MLHAYDQLVNYISAEAHSADLKRIIGVGFDGCSIFFVRYQGRLNDRAGKEAYVRQGPYPFNLEIARTLLTYLRALARLPLTAENLAERFGPKSEIAPMAVSAFADALENWGRERALVFFEEWKRLFGIVYGEQLSASRNSGLGKSESEIPGEEAVALSQLYRVGRETDFQELLFSVHTEVRSSLSIERRLAIKRSSRRILPLYLPLTKKPRLTIFAPSLTRRLFENSSSLILPLAGDSGRPL